VTPIVLDASAVAAWFIPDQATRSSDELLGRIATVRFLAPYIFPAECRNLLLKAQRRKVVEEAEADQAIEFLQAIDLSVQALPDRAGHDHALSLARRQGLSFYDALYLKVALEAAAAIASRDGALLQAAERCGLVAIDLRE
jgi:predicted nucleic acid-binding protein